MKITVYGKNIQLTNALKEVAIKKTSRLEKFFFQNVELKIVFSVENKSQKVELTIPVNGKFLRVEEASDDIYNALDDAIEAMEKSIRRYKTKLNDKRHRNESIRFENIEDPEEEVIHKIVKTKRFAIKPMSVEESVLQMDLLRHDFFVFLNAETDEVNVVYRRKDNNYGLIEPEF